MDIETHVKNFAGNKEQREAVKQFILEELEPQNWLPRLDLTLPDSEYASRVKVLVGARNELLAAFERMDKLTQPDKPPKTINPAR